MDLSKIKGKPVDAIGQMTFYIDFEQLRSPFRIEKIFGLINMKTNVVFKFKLVVTEDGPENMKLELTYVSEESIDCKIKIGNHPPELFEHLNISDKVKFFNCTKRNPAMFQRVCFDISVLVITTTSINNVFARMFNNQSTSDFTVKCQDKQFYVHQRILRERSEYFEAILHNDCIEKEDKILKIDDFQPNVVEIFLRYLYNGTFPMSAPLTWDLLFHLLKIADKYNANELFDAMDSYTSQRLPINLNLLADNQKYIGIQRYLNEFEEIQAPKVTTMFLVIQAWGDENFYKVEGYYLPEIFENDFGQNITEEIRPQHGSFFELIHLKLSAIEHAKEEKEDLEYDFLMTIDSNDDENDETFETHTLVYDADIRKIQSELLQRIKEEIINFAM